MPPKIPHKVADAANIGVHAMRYVLDAEAVAQIADDCRLPRRAAGCLSVLGLFTVAQARRIRIIPIVGHLSDLLYRLAMFKSGEWC